MTSAQDPQDPDYWSRYADRIDDRGGPDRLALMALHEGIDHEQILATFRHCYPKASPEFAESAAYHLVNGGLNALRNVLVDLRLTHETGQWWITRRHVEFLIYHLQHYLLLDRLVPHLPRITDAFLERLDGALFESEIKDASATLKLLRKYLREVERDPVSRQRRNREASAGP